MYQSAYCRRNVGWGVSSPPPKFVMGPFKFTSSVIFCKAVVSKIMMWKMLPSHIRRI